MTNPLTLNPPAGLSLTPPTVDSQAAGTYTNVNGLQSLKNNPDSPEAIAAVAQQVEALFLQMMLKSMRDASAEISTEGNELGMYQDMFDKQVALSMSQHVDLGISRLLKRQMTHGAAPPTGLGMGAPPTSSLGHTPKDFIGRMLPAVRRAAAHLNLNAEGLLAQSALETGWGQRMPRTSDGAPSYNMFGIKAGDDWQGARATADTVEIVDGVATPKRVAFRAYASPEESVADFAKLLATSPRYKEALAAGGDAQSYIESIARSGYATDPDYANKLSHILESGTIQAVLGPGLAKL